MANTAVSERVERLNTASLKRVIEPDDELPGHLGPGQVIPDELLSVHGLGLSLTDEQKITLSREEIASMLSNGIRFEAVLEAGFALRIMRARDLTDPRITYLLHEMGEETRHQRIFQRIVAQLAPQAVDPFQGKWLLRQLDRFGTRWIIEHPTLLFVLVLAGEEIPDLLQKLASEHPDTDPFLAEVNRYHRQEEARHLSFARAVLPEVWADAGRVDHFVIEKIAPYVIRDMFGFFIHPGVYETVGLPGWETWRAANATPERTAIRATATRPVLAALLDAGVLHRGRVPKGWRQLCGVDAHAEPVEDAVPAMPADGEPSVTAAT